MQSALVVSEPAKVQVAVKARSLHAQAQSLEAQAEAQNLQVNPQVSMVPPEATFDKVSSTGQQRVIKGLHWRCLPCIQ
jgi:hypothetical protein